MLKRDHAAKIRTLVHNTPAEGFTWHVVVDRIVLKSGAAKTHIEAIAAAEQAAQELEAEEEN
jgi:hypothetical protein